MVPQHLSNLTFRTYFLGTLRLGSSRTALELSHREDMTQEASKGEKDFSPPKGICSLSLDLGTLDLLPIWGSP